jgi:hypothetical protein
MVFNATFSSISVISWLSVLLVDKTGKSTKHEEDYYDLANRFYQTSL